MNFGHPSDVYGGAVSAALQIKNIPTGAGDDIKMDASWSRGASKYTLGTSSPDPSAFQIYKGTRFAMGVVTDAIYSGASANNGNPLTGLQLTNSWGFRGAYNHNWDPYWSSSLFGGIASLQYNATAKTLFCNTFSSTAGIAIGNTGNVTHGGGTGAQLLAGSVCSTFSTVTAPWESLATNTVRVMIFVRSSTLGCTRYPAMALPAEKISISTKPNVNPRLTRSCKS